MILFDVNEVYIVILWNTDAQGYSPIITLFIDDFKKDFCQLFWMCNHDLMALCYGMHIPP